MRLCMWYVCVIAVLLVSTTGRSEIVTDSDWSSDSSGGTISCNSGYSGAYASSDGDGTCWAGGEWVNGDSHLLTRVTCGLHR